MNGSPDEKPRASIIATLGCRSARSTATPDRFLFTVCDVPVMPSAAGACASSMSLGAAEAVDRDLAHQVRQRMHRVSVGEHDAVDHLQAAGCEVRAEIVHCAGMDVGRV